MGKKPASVLLSFFLMLVVTACAKNTMSDRDSRREQIRNHADNKRKELQLVAGDYRGVLVQDNGVSQNVSLRLEIKDIPTPVEGQVDPVLIPTLTGYVRFDFGGSRDDNTEYIGFAIQKAEFDSKQDKLDVIASHSDYKEIILGFRRSSDELKGTWTAPAIAVSGTAKLARATGTPPAVEALRGEYAGILRRESERLYQFGHLTVTTSFQPPEGLKVSAILRVIFGEWASTEYLTYRFDKVQFNPVSGQIVLKSESADVMFSGRVGRGEMQGEWSSSYTGKLGAAHFRKSTSAPDPSGLGTLFEALRGTYQGSVKSTNPQANLPERALVSFVTSQDLSQPNGIKITGNLRFYLGPFGSLEYIEMPLVDIQYNFFTRKLVAKTQGEYKLTIKADVSLRDIFGKIYSDALGEVANIEVTKQ